MSTSLCFQGFGIKGSQHVHRKYHDEVLLFRVQQEVFSRRGPECGSHRVKRRGLVMRRFRTRPIASMTVWSELALQRVRCLLCGDLRQVKVNFASWRRSYTRGLPGLGSGTVAVHDHHVCGPAPGVIGDDEITQPQPEAGTQPGAASQPSLKEKSPARHPIKTRFTKTQGESISDSATDLEWFVGPDQDMTWDQAKSWTGSLTVAGGGWRLLTGPELGTL